MGFSDLLTSGKGPGVIGTLLALLVLVGFGTLYIFVFDEGMQGGGKKITAIIREQEIAIQSDKEEIARDQKLLEDGKEFVRQADDLEAAKSQSQRNATQIATLGEEKQAAEKSIQDAYAKWEDYKDAYRASEWARAKGEKLGTLTSLSGKTYQDVVIREVNGKEMKITDSSGPKSINSDDLPAALQDRFQFDKEDKVVLEKQQNETDEVHRKRVQYAQAQQARNEKSELIAKLKEGIQNKLAAMKTAEDNIPAWNAKIEQKRADISRERVKKVSRAPIMEEELRGLQKQADDSRNSISRLGKEKSEDEGKIRTLEQEVNTLGTEMQKVAKELKDLQAAAGATAPQQ